MPTTTLPTNKPTIFNIFNIEVSDFPEERARTYVDGVNHVEIKKINFDEIDIPVDPISKKINSARSGDPDGLLLSTLCHSFKNSVHIHAPLPSVQKLRDMVEVNGVWKKYRLLDGHHRVAAIYDITDSYVFDVYEIEPENETFSRITFMIKSNLHPDHKKSSMEDITANGCILLSKGNFNNILGELSEDLISDWVEEVAGFRTGTNANKSAIKRIQNKADVHLPYENYPDKFANRWVREYLPNVKLNENGGHYWIMRKAPDRSFLRMLKKETDVIQMIILNPEPTSVGNVLQARQDLYDYIHNLAKDVWSKSGGTKPIDEVFKIVYALPQLRDSEDMKKPIIMDKIDD